jgi:isocitrate dehydrogenase (NAD+)
MIPGDGIGRELCESVRSVFAAMNVPVDFEQVSLSGNAVIEDTEGKALTTALDSLRRNKVGLKGTIHTGKYQATPKSLNVAIRKNLDLFSNVVQVRSFEGHPSRYPNIDLVIVRENLEGEYSGLEHSAIPGVIESLKLCTRANTERTIKFAFDWALKNGRKRITCVHKANIMKLGDGLFLRVFRDVASRYSMIEVNDMIVDNAAMQMVSRPQQFDVIVTSNLYGNIMANIAAGLIGSPGLVPGYNIGHDVAVFEPGARHVAQDIAGMNLANPVSMLLSSAFMLQHLGLRAQAARIREAVDGVIASGKVNFILHDTAPNITNPSLTRPKLRIWVGRRARRISPIASWNELISLQSVSKDSPLSSSSLLKCTT